jgi:two-component system, sensor histidine kinase and response regulator
MTNEGVPVLDLAVLAELRTATGDDDEFIADLIATYVGEGSEHIRAMADAISAGDVAGLVRPAHTLKSSSASIGALRLAAMCRGIEEGGREGRADGLAGQVEVVRGLWTATLAALAEAGLAS